MGLLIIEDNAAQREHAVRLITGQMPELQPVEAVASSEEALQLQQQSPRENLLLDIQLPSLSGVDLARRIWQRWPGTRILFWSHFKDEIYIRRLAEVVPAETVYGYVLKSSHDARLLQAARTVFTEDQCWLDREVRGVQARALHSPSALTEAEYEGLIDIALGLTDRGIARRRYLSRRGAQNRLHSLYLRLGVERAEEPGALFSPRNRAVYEGLRRGLVNADVLNAENRALETWIEENPDP